MSAVSPLRDYSLVGRDAEAAVANGLAAAEWYHTDIPRRRMKELMQRSDGPALRDTALWLMLLAGSGAGGVLFWGSWWCVPFFAIYGVLYGSATDSRWHECGHGTAFRTRWMNDAVYQLASFMIMREPAIWRWSHTRHHTDTIIAGLDPEIVIRPPSLVGLAADFFALRTTWRTLGALGLHAGGRLTVEEQTFIPESERASVFRTARIWIVLHACIFAAAWTSASWLPLVLVGILPTMYGAWLQVYFGLTQHAGLAENVLDHRLNSRTVYMNPAFRFVYWNMNYHIEHHMFPMVPYHALPELHRIMLPDTPAPYTSTLAVYRELFPALWKQRRDPGFTIKRALPSTARPYRPDLHGEASLP